VADIDAADIWKGSPFEIGAAEAEAEAEGAAMELEVAATDLVIVIVVMAMGDGFVVALAICVDKVGSVIENRSLRVLGGVSSAVVVVEPSADSGSGLPLVEGKLSMPLPRLKSIGKGVF
jgi:hypothetical protein